MVSCAVYKQTLFSFEVWLSKLATTVKCHSRLINVDQLFGRLPAEEKSAYYYGVLTYYLLASLTRLLFYYIRFR